MNDPNFDLSYGLPPATVPRNGLHELKRTATRRARTRRSLSVAAIVGVAACVGFMANAFTDHDQQIAQGTTTTIVPAPTTTVAPTTTTISNPYESTTTTPATTIRDWAGLQFVDVPNELKEEGWVDAELANGTAMRISMVSDSGRSYFWSSRQIGVTNGNPKWQVVSSIPLEGLEPAGCIGTCRNANGKPASTTVAVLESSDSNARVKSAWTMNPATGTLDAVDPSGIRR
jgi:hypothetical protein